MNNHDLYISNFPETMFPCQYSYFEEYGRHVISGMDLAKQSNILICGVVKDAESIIQTNLLRILRLGSHFKKYHAFIYENNSEDGTKDILSKFRNKNFTIKMENIQLEPYTHPKSQARRQNMAKVRNKYLTFARKYIKTNPVDYIFLIDLDLPGGWSYEGIFNSLSQSEVWQIVGSNSIYYHKTSTNCVWVLVDGKYKCKYCDFIVPHPHFNKNCSAVKNNENITVAHQRLTYDTWALRFLEDEKELDDRQANLYQFERGQPSFEVASCFGGLAIYKPETFQTKAKYTDEDCDHVTFHNSLRQDGYKIFLNPSQITLYNKSQYVI